MKKNCCQYTNNNPTGRKYCGKTIKFVQEININQYYFYILVLMAIKIKEEYTRIV